MDVSRSARAACFLGSIVALSAPLSTACGPTGNSAPPSSPGNAAATAPLAQPAPGYPASPPSGYPAAAPPGYPGTPAGYASAQAGGPPPAYPAAQPGYPPSTAAGAQAQGGYAAQPGYPAASPSYASAPPQPPPSAAPAAPQVPPAPLAPTDPNSLQAILAGIQGALQGTMVPTGSLPADVTQAGLKTQALRVAPGMQPEGDELKQSFAEGQHAVVMVTLQAGKCYSIVGFSPPGGVKELELNLLAPPLYVSLAGQNLTHGNAPTIGAAPSPMCPVIPFPLQYKLDVYARGGSGQAAVQLYSKAKPDKATK